MVSSSDVVPWVTKSTSVASDHSLRVSARPGSSSHGSRKPGVWEPCPGHTIASIEITLPNSSDLTCQDSPRVYAKFLYVSYKDKICSLTGVLAGDHCSGWFKKIGRASCRER